MIPVRLQLLPCHFLFPLALGADLPDAAFPEGFDGLAFLFVQ